MKIGALILSIFGSAAARIRATSFGKSLCKVVSKWLGISKIKRRLVFNASLGILVAIAVQVFQDRPTLKSMSDAAMDWMIQMNQGIIHNPEKAEPFVLIDIDEQTYRKWNEPLAMPRDKLMTMISFASEAKAKLIVVDIDVSKKLGKEDEQLERFLRDYGKDQDTSDPPIIFATTFREPIPSNGTQFVERRESFLDPTVEENPGLYWASTLFNRDSDLVIRTWRLYEAYCNQGVGGVIPAVQLLAPILINDGEGGAKKLQQKLNSLSPRCSLGASRSEKIDSPTIELNGHLVGLSQERLSSKIIFSVPWRASETGLQPPQVKRDGSLVPLVVTISADKITSGPKRISQKLFQNRVIVIGASHSLSHDIRATPLQLMPGALVLINAIHSLMSYGQLQALPLWAIIALQVFVIILFCLMFSFFSSSWAAFLAGGAVIIALLPMSFWLFKYGVWLDFALPLLAVQIRELIARAQEGISDSNQHAA
jgi:hypothetical protein